MLSKGQNKKPHRAPHPPGLEALPRAVYGHVESLPNEVLAYRHRHEWVQFAYAVQGVLEVQTDRGRYVAPPQRAVWIPAGVAHRVWCASGTSVRSLYIDREALDDPDRRCKVLVVSPLLRELIRTFSGMPADYDPASASGRIAAVLLDQIAMAREVDLMLPLPSNTALRQLCRAFQAHPDRVVSLTDWSERLGFSGKTLSRMFLRETGLTFRAWVQRTRLIHALALLERGDRVTDVALDCGYESLSAFIAAFAKLFNATPGDFFGSDAR